MNAEHLEVARLAVRIYAETHPRPPHVTQIQAAAMLNVSGATVSRMVKSGRLKLNKFGMIPIGEVDAALAVKDAEYRCCSELRKSSE